MRAIAAADEGVAARDAVGRAEVDQARVRLGKEELLHPVARRARPAALGGARRALCVPRLGLLGRGSAGDGDEGPPQRAVDLDDAAALVEARPEARLVRSRVGVLERST